MGKACGPGVLVVQSTGCEFGAESTKQEAKLYGAMGANHFALYVSISVCVM